MEELLDFQELEPTGIVDDLIDFIGTYLPDFKSSDEFLKILSDKKNENQHSLSFCVYMTNKCNSKFYFGRENAQKGNSVIDIGVYKGSTLIFTIEAKILPTPLNPNREEFEYVHGKGGGIERFKDGKHGLDNDNSYLPENGLIAFIKEDNFEFWLTKINKWIIEAKWDYAEKLTQNYSNRICKLSSVHPRADKTKFKLHHFWVKVDST